MKLPPHFHSLSLAALLATGIATAAYAAADLSSAEPPAAAAGLVSLAQAVNTAEQHLQGRATRAVLHPAGEGLRYEVEVLKGRQVFDVRVDAAKGTVLSATEDAPDRAEDGEDDDAADDE